MATPLLAALRESYPDAHLTWIAGPSESQAIDANPYLDELIIWDGGYFRHAWRHGQPGSAVLRSLTFWHEMRRRRYDIFVSLQPEEWPLMIRGSGASQTVGIFNTFARHWGEERNPHYQRLYTQSYSHPERHRTDQYLMVLEALGLPNPDTARMNIGFTAEDAEITANFLDRHSITARDRVAVLAPMTTWPTKCWPVDRYAALGDALVKKHGCRIVLIGSRKEEEELTHLASQLTVPSIIAAGTLTFRQMAALISRASLVVSGDTGPMHVAMALETPQLALFGSTSPQWYGPRSEKAISLLHPVPCGPCDQKICSQSGLDYLRCLNLITMQEVLEAVDMLLARIPA